MACHKALDDACMAQAENLWKLTEVVVDGVQPQNIRVMWSGGIDSTGVLVFLLRAAGWLSLQSAIDGCSGTSVSTEAMDRLSRLVVIMDDESISEYPWFYEKLLKIPCIRIERRDERNISSLVARTSEGLVVTGRYACVCSSACEVRLSLS